ncbi:hypothetical protein EVAR_86410_1 [Eumeta japonica]|uniref:Uncharacterized protein n=1 Tax=Eumeta variegata TaxID=151549 RepID=A0A4C1W9C9_EUMVA|nr:hypothetical protein EVAR_86410_1 [Eumeta japonica]
MAVERTRKFAQRTIGLQTIEMMNILGLCPFKTNPGTADISDAKRVLVHCFFKPQDGGLLQQKGFSIKRISLSRQEQKESISGRSNKRANRLRARGEAEIIRSGGVPASETFMSTKDVTSVPLIREGYNRSRCTSMSRPDAPTPNRPRGVEGLSILEPRETRSGRTTEAAIEADLGATAGRPDEKKPPDGLAPCADRSKEPPGDNHKGIAIAVPIVAILMNKKRAPDRNFRLRFFPP